MLIHSYIVEKVFSLKGFLPTWINHKQYELQVGSWKKRITGPPYKRCWCWRGTEPIVRKVFYHHHSFVLNSNKLIIKETLHKENFHVTQNDCWKGCCFKGYFTGKEQASASDPFDLPFNPQIPGPLHIWQNKAGQHSVVVGFMALVELASCDTWRMSDLTISGKYDILQVFQ